MNGGLNFLSGGILSICCFGVVFGTRRNAAISLLVGALFISQGASFEIHEFAIFPSRLLAALAFARVIWRGEFRRSRWNRLDGVLVALYVFMTVILVARPGEAVPLRLAKLGDLIFTYFAFRGLVQSLGEFRQSTLTMAYLLIPYCLLLSVEATTGWNPFELVGARSEPWLRGDRFRCFGSFRHPSLLGSLGAVTVPLFVALYRDGGRKWPAALGTATALAIVGFSNSGGPLSALAVAVVGWALWPVRHRMKLFRRALVAGLVLLALVMNAPIWYLIARLTSLTGGSGWHRSYLIELAVRHFDRWWFAGMPLSETRDWFPYTLAATGGADVTNQYVSFGLNAGIGAVILFLIYLALSFGTVGRALSACRRGQLLQRSEEPLLWGVAVALAVHTANWLGITYFDQFQVVWLWQMAAVGLLAEMPATRPTLAEPSSGDRAHAGISRQGTMIRT